MQLRSILIGTTLAASLLSSTAYAGPRLKIEAMVESDQIRLGDLIEGLEKGSEIAVFAAPAPGSRGTIRADRIVAAALEMGITGIETGATRAVTVIRSGRAISRNDMIDAISRNLADRGVKGDLEIILDDAIRARTFDAQRSGPLRIASFTRDTRSGRFEARIALAGAADAESWLATGSMSETREIAVLVNDVERGEAVHSKDVIMVKRPASVLGADVALTMADLVGMIPRRTLKAGEPVRSADLAKPILVEKNQLISVTYSSKGLSLAMRGRAQQNGALGETIRIQNPQSKRFVEGVVTGQGHVTITNLTPQTPPLADATPTVRR